MMGEGALGGFHCRPFFLQMLPQVAHPLSRVEFLVEEVVWTRTWSRPMKWGDIFGGLCFLQEKSLIDREPDRAREFELEGT